jgi:hypothetical protein
MGRCESDNDDDDADGIDDGRDGEMMMTGGHTGYSHIALAGLTRIGAVRGHDVVGD